MGALSPRRCWRAAAAQALGAGNCPVLGRASTAAASPSLRIPTFPPQQEPSHPSIPPAPWQGLGWQGCIPRPSLSSLLLPALSLTGAFLGSPPAAAFGVWGKLGVYHHMERPRGCSLPPSAGSGPRSHPATRALPAAFPFSSYLHRLSHFAAPSELFQSANWC